MSKTSPIDGRRLVVVAAHSSIKWAMANLKIQREHGDPLQIDLAEEALNASLDHLLRVTSKT